MSELLPRVGIAGAIGRALVLTYPLVGCAFVHPASAGVEQRQTEHPRATFKPTALPASQYWFYEAMGKLGEVTVTDDRVAGTYSERLQTIPFTVSNLETRSPSARTDGYKMAIERIIAYMAPGAIADIEDNRVYMQARIAKLKAITGMSFVAYADWKQWLDANRTRLKWSDEKNRLVVDE